MIEKYPHTDGDQSWEAICSWIGANVRMPDDRPTPEHVVKVLAVGAVIGARFSLLSPAFALGLADYANHQGGPLWTSIQSAFADGYMEWVRRQVEALYHNLGFTTVVTKYSAVDEGTPITDDDMKSIMDGLDGLFGKGAA